MTCLPAPPNKPALRIPKLLLHFDLRAAAVPRPAPSGHGVVCRRSYAARRRRSRGSAAAARPASCRSAAPRAAAPADRDGCGARKQSRRSVPLSMTSPRYMTTISSAMLATTPRSWVISSTAMPSSRCSSCISFRICAWIVTSSAVVGSSAISSAGPADQRHRDHRALAQAARQFERIAAAGRVGVGEADQAQHLDRQLLASAAHRRCGAACSASLTWSPIVCSGDSELIGSWKMIEMRPPRIGAAPAVRRRQRGEIDRLVVARAGRRTGSCRG